jgi:hypothetical protein
MSNGANEPNWKGPGIKEICDSSLCSKQFGLNLVVIISCLQAFCDCESVIQYFGS